MSRFGYLLGRFSGVHRWPVLGVPRGQFRQVALRREERNTEKPGEKRKYGLSVHLIAPLVSVCTESNPKANGDIDAGSRNRRRVRHCASMRGLIGRFHIAAMALRPKCSADP